MGCLKHGRTFDPNRCEIVDIKKAPVIDLVARDAPERGAVGLRFDETVQQIEAPGITWLAVESFHSLIKSPCGLRALVAQVGDSALDDLFFAEPFRDSFRTHLQTRGEVSKCRQNGLQLREVAIVSRKVFA